VVAIHFWSRSRLDFSRVESLLRSAVCWSCGGGVEFADPGVEAGLYGEYVEDLDIPG